MKRFHWVEIGLLVLLAAAIVLCSLRLVQDKDLPSGEEESVTHISLADAALSEESSEGAVGTRRTYSFDLPSEGRAGDCLVLYGEHQYATVRIDGRTRYTYEDTAPHFIRTSGKYWAFIPLGSADIGRTVELQLTSVYADAPVPDIRICRMNQIVGDVLERDLPLLLLGLLCVIQGMTLFVISLFSISDRHTIRTLLSLSMLTITAGIWKIAEMPVTTLLTHASRLSLLQPKAVYLFGMISFLIMPVFTAQFLISMRRSNRFYPDSVCVIVIELSAVTILALQIMGRAQLIDAVPFLMTEGAVLILVMLMLFVQRKNMRWLICLPISAGADLLITLLSGSSRYAVVLMVCIIVSDYISCVKFVRRTIRQKTELRDARTTALLAQIRPHFIHNTLTSIYYLCDSDPQAAKRLVRDFNEHLRANFTSLSVKTNICFEEEMENVRAYLSVEQTRFSDKLFVEYDLGHTAFRLPALTIQPLVENAVKHNVDSGKSPVHIRICSCKTADGSKVVIEDDGSGGAEARSQAHSHVGLKNVVDRLEILCGGTLTVEPRAEGGTVATVFIPDTPS